jgi:hypothetical protein
MLNLLGSVMVKSPLLILGWHKHHASALQKLGKCQLPCRGPYFGNALTLLLYLTLIVTKHDIIATSSTLLSYVSYQSQFWKILTSVFFPSNLWGSWVGLPPQEDLAKFGFRLEWKVEIFGKLCYIFATCYNVTSKIGDFQFNFPHIVARVAKTYILVTLAFFCCQDMKIHQKQKH